MKHAFLIIAHENWTQVKALISVLDSELSDIYIHVNKNLELPDMNEIRKIASHSKVIFTKRCSITWGKYGILEASLILLKTAILNHYDYYHLLTGSDFPLKSIYEIDEFFYKNKFLNEDGTKITNYLTLSNPNKKIISRIKYYNTFISLWRNKNKVIRKLGTSTSTLLCIVQKIVGVNRLKNSHMKFYTGSSWWSISHDFAIYVLSNEKWIEKQFKEKTFAADEFAYQTLFMNSKFRYTLYNPVKNEHGNLRLLDFNRGNGYGSPYVWRIKDLEEIEKSNDLFCRKIDSLVDHEILDYLLNKVSREKRR